LESSPPSTAAGLHGEEGGAYKYPRTVWFLDELPKEGTGKVLKREIQAPEAVAARVR
jgi:long-chain acyl-CoA synthetase